MTSNVVYIAIQIFTVAKCVFTLILTSTVTKKFLEEIYGDLKTLISESHYHQQDLSAIRDDLGALKFGFALLQHTTTDLRADSKRHSYKLQQIEATLDHQHEKIEHLSECLEDTKTETTLKLDRLQSDVDGVGTCLETHKTETTQEFSDLLFALDNVNVGNGTDCPGTSSHPCGDLEEWVKVVDFDMTDPTTSCLPGWLENTDRVRTCGRPKPAGSRICYPATLPFIGGTMRSFSKVCGRVRAYARGSLTGFYADGAPIAQFYVAGVTLTAGPEHLWTFAAGQVENDQEVAPFTDCPCDTEDTSNIQIPSFVGNNYFCESHIIDMVTITRPDEYYTDDPLWDGLNCHLSSRCCDFNQPPYFINFLGKTIEYDEIDAKICLKDGGATPHSITADDIRVEQIEIYVAP